MTPPGLLAAALLLWGIAIGQAWIGIALAIAIGGAFALYQANSSPARPSQSPTATPTTAPLPPSLRGPFATLQQTVQR